MAVNRQLPGCGRPRVDGPRRQRWCQQRTHLHLLRHLHSGARCGL